MKDRERLKATTSSERPLPPTGSTPRLLFLCGMVRPPVAVEALAHKTLTELVGKWPTVANLHPPSAA